MTTHSLNRPADCPGETCQNRNRPHTNCITRQCIGIDQCGNHTGRYCHAHEYWCSPSTCSCKSCDPSHIT